MMITLRVGLLALAALVLPALNGVQGDAHAQQSGASLAAPRIDGFDVQPVAQPVPGSELVFTLYGSPGGSVVVQIRGATGTLALPETETGVYEGSYTIRQRDRVTASSTATANLRLGNKVASALLDEPLVGRPNTRRPAPAARAEGVPRIDRFDIDPPSRLAANEELVLSIYGTPGGSASARIVGVRGKIVMNEVRDGVYEGAYTLKTRDRIAANAVVTGTLRLGKRETSAVLGKSLLASTVGRDVPRDGGRNAARPVARVCEVCGVVEAINVVEVKGDGSYLGKILGGAAGAIIGSQVGSGRGTTVAEVAGAVGGAVAGNEVEKRMKTSKHFEVVVRLENGGAQTVSYTAQPAFAVGTRVRVENGVLSEAR